MNLRPELTPPPINPEKFQEICRRITEISYLVEDCGEEAFEEIADFNRFAGKSYNRHQFQKYWTAQSLEEFATDASRSDPKPVADITTDELIEVVRRAMCSDTDPAEAEYYRTIFEANVPLEKASTLLSYPLDYDDATGIWGDGRPISEYDPTPEEVVRQALSGKKWSS